MTPKQAITKCQDPLRSSQEDLNDDIPIVIRANNRLFPIRCQVNNNCQIEHEDHIHCYEELSSSSLLYKNDSDVLSQSKLDGMDDN